MGKTPSRYATQFASENLQSPPTVLAYKGSLWARIQYMATKPTGFTYHPGSWPGLAEDYEEPRFQTSSRDLEGPQRPLTLGS